MQGGSFQLNPPYDAHSVVAVHRHLARIFERFAEAAPSAPLSFILVTAQLNRHAVEDTPGLAKYVRHREVLRKHQHQFRVGMQHKRTAGSARSDPNARLPEGTRTWVPDQFDTEVVWLQNNVGADVWPCTQVRCARVVDGFRLEPQLGDPAAAARDELGVTAEALERLVSVLPPADIPHFTAHPVVRATLEGTNNNNNSTTNSAAPASAGGAAAAADAAPGNGSGAWVCGMCTGTNDVSDLFCTICTQPRASGMPPPPPQSVALWGGSPQGGGAAPAAAAAPSPPALRQMSAEDASRAALARMGLQQQAGAAPAAPAAAGPTSIPTWEQAMANAAAASGGYQAPPQPQAARPAAPPQQQQQQQAPPAAAAPRTWAQAIAPVPEQAAPAVPQPQDAGAGAGASGWQCGHCRIINDHAAGTCRMCDTPMGGRAPPPQQQQRLPASFNAQDTWCCNACTTTNHALEHNCAVCNQTRF